MTIEYLRMTSVSLVLIQWVLSNSLTFTFIQVCSRISSIFHPLEMILVTSYWPPKFFFIFLDSYDSNTPQKWQNVCVSSVETQYQKIAAWNNADLVSCSVVTQETKISITRLKSRCQQWCALSGGWKWFNFHAFASF